MEEGEMMKRNSEMRVMIGSALLVGVWLNGLTESVCLRWSQI